MNKEENQKAVYFTHLIETCDGMIDIFTVEHFNVNDLVKYNSVFIRENKWYKNIVKKIRRHFDPQIYLIPIFIKKDGMTEIIDYGKEIIDGIINVDSVDKYYEANKMYIDNINLKIKDLHESVKNKISTEYELSLKVLRYMYTRQKNLHPVRFSKSLFGYSYPNVDIFFPGNSYQEFTLINFLKNKSLIKGSFIDNIHPCNNCYSSYLNFREICVKCNSADIDNEDLVHHFVCGFVGLESDFYKDDKQICPKCRKEIRHLGVDFDRPSQMYTCKSCEHTFQDPDVDTICVNCGKKSSPDKLSVRTIEEYSLTPLGENSAINGVVFTLKDELEEKLEIIEQPFFRKLLNLEIERIKRYKKSLSTIVKVSFVNYMEIIAHFGNKLEEMNRQITTEINSFIRTTDIISFLNDAVLLFLFPETNYNGCSIAIKRIQEQICIMVKNNLSIELNISYQIIEIDGKLSEDKILSKLTEDV